MLVEKEMCGSGRREDRRRWVTLSLASAEGGSTGHSELQRGSECADKPFARVYEKRRKYKLEIEFRTKIPIPTHTPSSSNTVTLLELQ